MPSGIGRITTGAWKELEGGLSLRLGDKWETCTEVPVTSSIGTGDSPLKGSGSGN